MSANIQEKMQCWGKLINTKDTKQGIKKVQIKSPRHEDCYLHYESGSL